MTTYTGTAGADVIAPWLISGGVTPASPIPGAGADTLYGGKGNDTLHGGGGSDASYGGDGNDHIYAVLGTDSAYGGDGIDTLDSTGYNGNYTVNLTTGLTNFAGELYVGFENLITTNGNDMLTGTEGANLIYSGAGNDTINFSGGDDTTFGGAGNDYVYASDGVNVLDGGDDIDTLDTTILVVDYTINLATGLTNFAGESILNFENIVSGDGNDLLTGTNGTNRIEAGWGDDTIALSLGQDDQLFGGAGNDLIIMIQGYADGGDGTDTVDFSTQSDVGVQANLTTGIVTIFGDVQVAALTGVENFIGTESADLLTGTDGSSVLNGGAGNDTITFSGGDDTLLGGDGDDLIVAPGGVMNVDGGIGSDTLDVRSFDLDYAINLATGVTTYAGESVLGIETLLMGDGNDTLTAAATGSTIDGGIGNDVIMGGGGQDLLMGGAGDNTLTGGIGDDTLEAQGASNLIHGNGGNDLIEGSGAANDQLYGDGGNDRFQYLVSFTQLMDGGIGSDTVDFSVGARSAIALNWNLTTGAKNMGGQLLGFENVTCGTGADTLTGNGVANSFFGSVGSDSLSGLAGADVLYGGADDDTLLGGVGADTLMGSTGVDVLQGDGGADLFVFEAGDSTNNLRDRIVGFDGAGAAVGDRIDLRLIDANASTPDDQVFIFGGTTKGHLRVVNSGDLSIVQGNTDNDAAFEFVLVIEDGGVLASAYTAADFML